MAVSIARRAGELSEQDREVASKTELNLAKWLGFLL
jgi:hypothetical protein